MQHLRDNCFTYTEHLLFSFTLALLFFQAACASVLHAIIPSMFTTYASDMVRDISARLEAAGCKEE